MNIISKIATIICLIALPIFSVQAQQGVAKNAQKEKAKAVALERKLSILDNKIKNINSEIKQYSNEMKEFKNDLQALNMQEEKLRKKLHNELSSFDKTAVTLARVERLPLQAIAFSNNLRDGHTRLGVAEQGRKSLSSRITNNRAEIVEVQEIQKQKEELHERTKKLHARLLKKRHKLENLFVEHLATLTTYDTEKAQVLKEAHVLQKAPDLDSAFASLSNNKKILPKTYVSYNKLPVNGRVIQHYKQEGETGIRAHGITIEAAALAAVKAPKSGRVIYSGIFRDYGYIVILEHRGGVHSLYSGLQGSIHEVGAFVRSGNTIGLMPSSEKPQLYMEVRYKGKTKSPRKWLGKGV